MTPTERGDVILQGNDVAFSIVTALPFYPNATATHYEVHHIVCRITSHTSIRMWLLRSKFVSDRFYSFSQFTFQEDAWHKDSLTGNVVTYSELLGVLSDVDSVWVRAKFSNVSVMWSI